MSRLTLFAVPFVVALIAASPANDIQDLERPQVVHRPLSTGNLLGNIVVPAVGSQNNRQTAVPFTIPVGTSYIIAVIDGEAAGYSFRTGTSSSLAATVTDFNQIGPASIQIPLQTNTGVAQVVAFFNNGAGGTVHVYASDGKAAD